MLFRKVFVLLKTPNKHFVAFDTVQRKTKKTVTVTVALFNRFSIQNQYPTQDPNKRISILLPIRLLGIFGDQHHSYDYKVGDFHSIVAVFALYTQ